MGGQDVERRQILRYIGIAAIAGTFPGFSKWVFACPGEHPAASAPVPADSYKPLFFSPRQYQVIERLADLIIPEDDTPGAKQAGVAEFIDFMVANRVAVTGSHDIRSTDDAIAAGNEAQVKFADGFGWIDAHCRAHFGEDFLDCSAEQQNALLEELAYKTKFKPATESGRSFFHMVRDYTVIGYYTTKIGLQSLGYPGLRAIWPKMPGCSHPDDPAHANLREPSIADNPTNSYGD